MCVSFKWLEQMNCAGIVWKRPENSSDWSFSRRICENPSLKSQRTRSVASLMHDVPPSNSLSRFLKTNYTQTVRNNGEFISLVVPPVLCSLCLQEQDGVRETDFK